MSQIQPNFTRADSQSNGASPIQTMRLQTQQVGSGPYYIDAGVTFPFPFSDANYTVSMAIESEPDSAGNAQFTTPLIRNKTATGFAFRAYNSGSFDNDPYTVHIVAFHD
jgi:hypothetical protein